jgi:hypothetical protein
MLVLFTKISCRKGQIDGMKVLTVFYAAYVTSTSTATFHYCLIFIHNSQRCSVYYSSIDELGVHEAPDSLHVFLTFHPSAHRA